MNNAATQPAHAAEALSDRDAIRALAAGGNYLPEAFAYRTFADLNGAAAARFLRGLGFDVVGNRDTGHNGEAWTACGVYLSTNGWCWRKD